MDVILVHSVDRADTGRRLCGNGDLLGLLGCFQLPG